MLYISYAYISVGVIDQISYYAVYTSVSIDFLAPSVVFVPKHCYWPCLLSIPVTSSNKPLFIIGDVTEMNTLHLMVYLPYETCTVKINIDWG